MMQSMQVTILRLLLNIHLEIIMSKLPDVAPLWRIRFDLIEKAGGPKLPTFKKLRIGERFRLRFNLWALIFGPIYYLAKGMWRKAISYSLISFAVLLLLDLVLLGDIFEPLKHATGTVLSVYFGLCANINYYRKMVLNDDGWW